MKKIIILLLICFLFSGCYTTKAFVNVEQQQATAIEEAKVATTLMLQNWKFRSGLIRGALQGRLDVLPQRTVAALDELDRLAAEEKLDDRTLGYALGLRISMLQDIVKEMLKQYAPNILQYVKF